MGQVSEDQNPQMSLGEYLAYLRSAAGLTLRQVEDATEKVVSNAYLSQLENDKIAKPSPNILHALARVYGASYEALMHKAGYLTSEPSSDGRRRARAATLPTENLTPEEEEALLKYLAFIRQDRKKP
jgi:transcriptional regulator with XRE-family HTH domain